MLNKSGHRSHNRYTAALSITLNTVVEDALGET